MVDEIKKIGFVKNGNDYWLDINGNGRHEDEEIFSVNSDENWEEKAITFVRNFTDQTIKPYLLAESYEDYFNNPVITSKKNQLDIDIKELETMKPTLDIYQSLLEDLKLIQDETQYTQAKENPDLSEKYEATYNIFSAHFSYRGILSDIAFIHEMDHGVIYQRTTEPYSFKLDFPKDNVVFTFDKKELIQPSYRSLELGQKSCLTESSKASSLAMEVHAFQVLGRYLAFKIGLTQKEIDVITSQQTRNVKFDLDLAVRLFQNYFKQSVEFNMNKIDITSNQFDSNSLEYKSLEYTDLLIHYFGKGGEQMNSHLGEYVLYRYRDLNKDDNFVDSQGCIPW